MKTPLTIGSKFRKVLIITLCWVGIQLMMYVNSYFLIADQIAMKRLEGSYAFWPDLLGNVVLGALSGLVGGYFLVYRINARYRQRTFMSDILKSALYFVLIFFSCAVCIIFLMTFLYIAFNEGAVAAWHRSWENVMLNLYTPSFIAGMCIWAVLVAGTQFMLQVNDKFGPGILWKFLTGRYYHPRDEQRIFMFLDLRSSTSIAEEIGNQRYFELLKELYQDVTGPVLKSLGEIYQYVGDEVIISWPIEKGLRDWNCLRCFFKIEHEITKRKMDYEQKYGFLPSFKAGMHLGAATVGEIGVIKKDIVYSGDVLNTTSRIQGECNRHQVSLLISSDLLVQLPLNNNYIIRPIGEISLRGKAEKIQLSSVCLN